MNTIDCTAVQGSLPPLWNQCVGAGRACEGLRAEWQNQLRRAVADCGFRYLRCHGLLAEDMFVCHRDGTGNLRYQWRYIDAFYDFLLDAGVRPFVEFGFMPPALASGTSTQFWWKGNVTPPRDMAEWEVLIYALTSHWKERYGLGEIRQWYFEVWNEPDLHAFWDGTKSQYFELYRHTVLAVKRVDERLRVGGPATSNFVPDGRFDGETEDRTKHLTHTVADIDSLSWRGVWIEDFLRFCAREKLPVDFVSTHPYPTDFALDGQSRMRGRSRNKDSLRQDILWLRQAIAASAYPHAEIHLTEWSSSPSSRDCAHDGLPAADYIVKSNLDCAGLADSLSYWTFTDIFEEAGGGPAAFHGGFGLMSLHGIRKPAYHAYRFLNGLGNQILAREEQGIVTRNEKGQVQALFYNYAEALREAVPTAGYPRYDEVRRVQDMGGERTVAVELTGLCPCASFLLERMAREDTALDAWERMGRPANLTRAQEEALQAVAPKKQVLRADQGGRLRLSLMLQPWELAFLRQLDG